MRPPSSPLLAVLVRNPEYRLFWAGNLISSTGVWMQNLAQGWLLLQVSDSPLLLGVAGFTSLGPTLALSLIGGTIADRVDRRRILLLTHAGLMLLALVLGAVTSLAIVTPALILGISLLSGIATALTSPAYQATIPDLVPPTDLTRAIALNSIQFNLARIGGHAVAGVLVVWIGVAGCFYVNGLTYVAMLYALWRIRPSSGHQRGDTTPFWTRFTEGFRYVRTQPAARSAIAMIGAMSGLGLPYFFLLPSMGRDVLGQGADGVGYLMASVSLGALTGALSVTTVTERVGRSRTAVSGSLLFWIALIGFSASRSYALSIAWLVALGFTLVMTVVAANNLLQILAPPDMRGRVMGIYAMALNGLAPLGGLLAGALAAAASSPAAIGGMAAVGLGLTAILVAQWKGSPDEGRPAA